MSHDGSPDRRFAPGVKRESLEDIVAEVSPSCVSIGGYLKDALPRSSARALSVKEGQPLVSGSGFFIADNLIATNRHVVESGHFAYKVRLNDGEIVDAEVEHIFPQTDFAILKIKKRLGKPAALGDSGKMRRGTDVFTLGNSFGMFHKEPRLSKGVITSISEFGEDASLGGSLKHALTTDAGVAPGNSGGPLFNAETGEVVGMNTAIMRGAGPVTFAISSNEIAELIEHRALFKKVHEAIEKIVWERNDEGMGLNDAVAEAIKRCKDIVGKDPAGEIVLNNRNTLFLLGVLISDARKNRGQYAAKIGAELGVTVAPLKREDVEDYLASKDEDDEAEAA